MVCLGFPSDTKAPQKLGVIRVSTDPGPSLNPPTLTFFYHDIGIQKHILTLYF